MVKKEKDYPQIDILFFERPLVDLKKFAFKIANNIKTMDQNLICGAIANELPTKDDNNCIDFFFHRSEIKDIDYFLKKAKIRLIVLTQNRIPDLEILLHAKKMKIKTVLIQEGIMFDGTNINDVSARSIFSMFAYIPKVFEYLGIMKRMCKYSKISYFGAIKRIFKDKIDITTSFAKYFPENLICDYVFTMGSFWDNYYIDRKGFSKEQIILVGDHDLDGFKPNDCSENAYCYIANTLVEDGTISKKRFSAFIQALSASLNPTCKLYIKLHPRSDINLYKELESHNVEYIRQPGFLPSVNVYIGHRSALLGKALYESDNLIIWRFPNENVCFYEKYASFVCSSESELKSALKKIDLCKKSNDKREIVSQVYWCNPYGAIKTISRYCVSYLCGDLLASKYVRGCENENCISR